MLNYPQIKSSFIEDAKLTRKLVRRLHCETLHRGVELTMAAIREKVLGCKIKASCEESDKELMRM